MTHRIHEFFLENMQALQVFFRKRVRGLSDTRDLTQEVYLRLLRVDETRIIHNPDAYLFTVANNLLKERRVMERRAEREVPVEEVALTQEPKFESELEEDMQRRVLTLLIPELPARTRLVLHLAFDQGLTHQEIARRVGISKSYVGKIIDQAIVHCRERLVELEGS